MICRVDGYNCVIVVIIFIVRYYIVLFEIILCWDVFVFYRDVMGEVVEYFVMFGYFIVYVVFFNVN